MKKEIAIKLLGGTVGHSARAIGISSQAVTQWPDVLPSSIADRVIAGMVRIDPELSKEVEGRIARCSDSLKDTLIKQEG